MFSLCVSLSDQTTLFPRKIKHCVALFVSRFLWLSDTTDCGVVAVVVAAAMIGSNGSTSISIRYSADSGLRVFGFVRIAECVRSYSCGLQDYGSS